MNPSQDKAISLPAPVEPPRPPAVSLLRPHDVPSTSVGDAVDLEGFDQQCRSELQQLKRLIIEGHRDLTFLAVSTAGRALMLGKYCLRAKELLGHGRFLKWIDSEITQSGGPSRRTVQRYVKLARDSPILLERISQLFASEDEVQLDPRAATELLEGLKLQDAVSILRFGTLKQRPTSLSQAVSLQPYIDAAGAFFDESNAPFLTHLDWESGAAEPLTGRLLISPSDSRNNRVAVEETTSAYGNGTLREAILLLSGGGATQWLGELDDFPRLLIRHRDVPDGKHFVFALTRHDRFAAFHRAFGELGAVLVPFFGELPGKSTSHPLPTSSEETP